MAAKKHMVAFDCGNSSYRVVLGTYDGEKITMEVISQIANEMVEIGGKFYWDFLAIFQNLCYNEPIKSIPEQQGCRLWN